MPIRNWGQQSHLSGDLCTLKLVLLKWPKRVKLNVWEIPSLAHLHPVTPRINMLLFKNLLTQLQLRKASVKNVKSISVLSRWLTNTEGRESCILGRNFSLASTPQMTQKHSCTVKREIKFHTNKKRYFIRTTLSV